jgi:tetratricopeptide (TPR) repeat protein
MLGIFCAFNAPALAKDYVPESDDQTFHVSSDYTNPRNKLAEEQRVRAIAISIQEKALFAEMRGDYAQALECWQHESKLMPEAKCLETNAARCMDKLGRHNEALAIVKHILDRKKSTDAFRLKIEIETELGQFQEALKTCRAYEEYYDLEGESPTLASTVYLAMGDRDKSVESAREAYFRCARNGLPTDEAVKQLKNLNVSVPESIPYSGIANAKALANIEYLLKCSKRLTKTDLRAIFETGSEYTFGTCLHSHRRLFFRYVCYNPSPLAPNGPSPYAELRVDIDGNRCDITRADLENKIGVLEPTESYSETRKAGQLKGAMYTLVFGFDSSSGQLRQYSLQIPIEMKIVKQPIKQPVPPSLDQIKQDLEQNRWRLAANKLMRHWDYYLGMKGGGEEGYKQYLEVKQLLIQAYRGLELDDIARYIERAPCYFLRTDISQRYQYTDLPTSAEYAGRKWTINGSADDPQHGFYSLNVEGYPPVPFYPASRYFEDVYKLAGTTRRLGPRPISVLPCEWIDAITYQLK